MGFLISTGLQTHLITTGDLKTALDGKVIKIYGAAASQAAADALVPGTADAAIGSALLLCTVSVNGAGTGITFEDTPSGGALVKTASETWTGTNVASGYPSFYRLETSGDDGSLSTSAVRCQGTVGQIGTDLIIAANYLTVSQAQDIDSYLIGVPKA